MSADGTLADLLSLDLIGKVVLDHLPQGQWVDAMLVCKRWLRAIRIPAIARLIDSAAQDRRNPNNRTLDADAIKALKPQERALIVHDFRNDAIQASGRLREFKLAARRWAVAVAKHSGDKDAVLVLRYMTPGPISPLDFVDPLERVTILERIAEVGNCPILFKGLLEKCIEFADQRKTMMAAALSSALLRATASRNEENIRALFCVTANPPIFLRLGRTASEHSPGMASLSARLFIKVVPDASINLGMECL